MFLFSDLGKNCLFNKIEMNQIIIIKEIKAMWYA